MRFCSTCGEPIKDDEKYCKNCGHKNPKKRNMIIYFILMVILFLVFEIVSSLIYSEVYAVIKSSRFGMYFVVESIWAATVFIMMVLAGNKYILYRKKEPLWKSMKLAFPPMFLAIISTIYNFGSAISFNYVDVICLAFYCLAIGLVEEFMCRGWLLTEFIERYGYDRKHIRLAIVCSALVFGCMHFTNILAGQEVFETVCQVIQTLGSGYLFGALFYRTRNIWSCVLVHAFYDFSIFLGEIKIYDACTYGTMTDEMKIASLISSILLAVIYVINGEILIRPTKVNSLLPKPKENTKEDIAKSDSIMKIGVILMIICSIGFLYFPSNEYEGYKTCKNYPFKDINGNYYIKSYYVDTVDINYNDYSLTVNINELTVNIKNNNTGYINNLNIPEDSKVLVIKNNNYFVVTAYNSEKKKIYYKQIKYTDITDENSFIDNIMNDTKEYISPTVTFVGSISFDDSEEEYAYFQAEEMPDIMIDSDSELYELNIN